MNKLHLPMLDKNLLHIMVDVETTATSPRAGIWQIGAVTFAEVEPKEFLCTIHPHSGPYGNDIGTYEWDERTIDWQVKSNTMNWSEAFALSVSHHTVSDMLIEFKNWINECRSHQSKLAIWSKGSYFDIPILEHAFKTEGILLPWRYNEIYDARTIFNLTGHVMPKFDGAHNALNDARHQAAELEKVFRELF